MKHITRLLTSCLLLLLISSSVPYAYAGTIQHRFRIELPNGEVVPLAGGPVIHSVYKDNISGKDVTTVSENCYYKGTSAGEHSDRLSSEYQCVTPSGCDYSTFHSPIFPAGFNKTEPIYSNAEIKDLNDDQNMDMTEASHAYFDPEKKNFTTRYPWAAGHFSESDPLGGSKFSWKGSVAQKSGTFRIIDGTKPSQVGDPFDRPQGSRESYLATMDSLWSTVYWRKYNGNTPSGDNPKKLENYDKKTVTNWSNGSILYNGNGHNVLHGSVTWTLKSNIPTETVEKPTASFAGRCTNNSPGVASYTFTLSNIDLKGANFKSSHLHLNVTKGAWTNEFKQQFGPPIYESTDANGIMSYSLGYNTTQPTNNTLTWNVTPDRKIGNQATNTKTVTDLVKWVDAKKAAGVTIPFEVVTNLESEKDGKTTLNDSIKVASNGFKPKFVTNECGQPTGGGTIPACVSIKMLNGDNAPITNVGALLPGALVKFECGPVTGVTKYAFRLITHDAQGAQVGNPTNIQPESTNSNRSRSINIPNEGGKFTAQCAICDNNSTNCQFDIPNYNPPSPSTVVQCASPNSCVTASGCITRATSGTCATSGQVCCANRSRDE